MNSDKERLRKILELARKARPPENAPATDAAPLGFATRVAATWAHAPAETSIADVWERLSWWGTGLAAAACLIALTIHVRHEEPTGFDLLLGTPAIEQSF